jgi:hypothetical protein
VSEPAFPWSVLPLTGQGLTPGMHELNVRVTWQKSAARCNSLGRQGTTSMRFAMADDKSRVPRKRPADDRGRRMDSGSDAGFDRWLVDQLRKLYDEVLDEEVPDDLVKVVRSFDAGQGGGTAADRERPEAEEPPRTRGSRRTGG